MGTVWPHCCNPLKGGVLLPEISQHCCFLLLASLYAMLLRRAWFDDQLALASKATSDRGLFVGLRLDGRTRSSGMGSPPWARYAAELAPLEGEDKWTGFFDGFDGRV